MRLAAERKLTIVRKHSLNLPRVVLDSSQPISEEKDTAQCPLARPLCGLSRAGAMESWSRTPTLMMR